MLKFANFLKIVTGKLLSHVCENVLEWRKPCTIKVGKNFSVFTTSRPCISFWFFSLHGVEITKRPYFFDVNLI